MAIIAQALSSWISLARSAIQRTPGTHGSGMANTPKTMFWMPRNSWVGEAADITQPDSGITRISR